MKSRLLGAIREAVGDSAELLPELISENLLAPTYLKLPVASQQKIKSLIGHIYRIYNSAEYREKIGHSNLPKNFGICSSVDIHLTPTGPKVIEINTNAAFLAMGYFLFRAWGIEPSLSLEELVEMFREDSADVIPRDDLLKVAIVDDQPSSQRLYIEFLVYKLVLRKFGISCEIKDVREALDGFNFIYNRSTDFFFDNSESQNLKKMWSTPGICVSPNPESYALLADKERLQQIPKFFPKDPISEFLPVTTMMTAENCEQLWMQRKKLFFKPSRAYGSKMAFKGASISRRMFDVMIASGAIAQEYVPAPEIEFQAQSLAFPSSVNTGEWQTMKYDLRCFFYKDRLQMVVARLYQGQVTNLKTPNGGFAPVVFTK